MTFEEFQRITLPLARKLGCLPEDLSPAIRDEFVADLYEACRNPPHARAARSALFDKWSTLNLDFGCLAESVIAIVRNYAQVKEFEVQGVSLAKLICYKALPECPHGNYVSVADLLVGFNTSGSMGVVVPCLDCPRNAPERGDVCSGRLLPSREFPKNMAWLKAILESEQGMP